MGIIDSIAYSLRFRDTVFYKEKSDLKNQFDALEKLNKEYPGNDELLNELYIVKKGLAGEDEISYQIKKANIGMYVLRDMKFKYGDMTAQIDYIVITPAYTYFIECKNLIGNITVNAQGDFIREYTVNGRKIRKGMYSPLRQVEAQREVFRKIWESKVSAITNMLASRDFDYYRRVLVVAANSETILNVSKAPKDIKNRVIRADMLVSKIEYDIDHCKDEDYDGSEKSMKKAAQAYIDYSSKEDIDYYSYYKSKFILSVNDDLTERLKELRKNRSSEMHIPAYYVFTNEELEKIAELRPNSLDELRRANILAPIKIKTHGDAIIDVVNAR